jgi:tetratricopeptide (TPR) repeat protein
MSKPLNQSTALVIDDFPSMRTMIMGFLKSMGLTRLSNAGSAKDALTLLSQQKFDIVICDYNLGHGQNGQQILEAARHKGYIGYSTIWVMVTAEKTMDMFMGAAETKPDDYLLKPVTEALLESRLNKLIEKKQALEPIELAVCAKDYLKALSHCNAMLQIPSGTSQDAQRIKSELLMEMGDFQNAKVFFEHLLAARSTSWARTGLGKVQFMNKEYEAARNSFQAVLKENKMYLEAADWLAKTLDVLGEPQLAQQVLNDAMALSPNAVARQQRLADCALKNGDLKLAQSAYEKAIKLGEHSVHKNAGAYAGLAKTLTARDEPETALKVLGDSRTAFKDDPAALLQTAVAESMAYQQMGEPEKASKALAEAESLAAAQPEFSDAGIALDMASLMLQQGDKDKAMALLAGVVKNNHENPGVLQQVEGVFAAAGMQEEGGALIKQASQEVVSINNQGVKLANEGKFEEGITLIRQAVSAMPNNDLMLTNLCGMLIGLMNRAGKNAEMVAEARALLERVGRINPANKKYTLYLNLLGKMTASS